MWIATTKIWAVKDSLKRVVDYASYPEKTEYSGLANALHYAENGVKTELCETVHLVSGLHCRPEQAWDDMRSIQEHFGKTGGTVALHAYQSFKPGEVTPEQCHAIGVELARKMWGGRFQVLVATHLNTNCLHNHFVINSVSYIDGKKYEQKRSVPFPVSWTVKMKKKQKETQDILSYHTQAAGCSDKARAKASGGRQPIEECGRTGL
ncbi:MAG: relaxase/mobilization nuclease domain-containing protein [Ruthenibacterium lactatiformans]|uniref:relaxase/mobilization nuclease domain-containing protein n=1 Tax=Ruthenibacterium lactatiformans TaxID=1550024 RepID=UPI00399378B0